MANAPLSIIQISDIHLFSDPEKSLLKVKTEDSFKAVVQLIKQQQQAIDLILLSGDLSQDGSEQAYIRLAEILKNFNVPVYYVPGNHDDIHIMQQVYPREMIVNDKQILFKQWQIILLDSKKPNAVAGYLDQKQLDYMQACIKQYPNHRAIIVFHHQPISVGCKWLDPIGLTNAAAFWQVVACLPQVHTVIFGHVHQEFWQLKQGVHCYAPPSTCIQFKPNQINFALDNIPPGYRWIKFYDDGQLETGINRVAKYIGEFDQESKGY